ncbi:helix-turn-helix transcriptional regulator [Mobilitalea sibirica]|uniref:Helix-turn-helix transcriptional regulator n=1 Tax=Mobilitalea sibirica TaxID=1462919 RepID=A0A8J7H463_9FIRM|nr:AraC family transcriptional regulator [Mobilitalea sibirica]MBH1942133.1 helix-turn-helix transcriptional regulator [Mobilitalea sibirica]
MDYSFFIWSTATFIESRLKDTIDYHELEATVGFSYRHIRETFKECTGVSLSRYILSRKIANSAFDIFHTDRSLTQIASDYMFNSYDTFTRAFKRHLNYIPSQLRNPSCKLRVGRKRILIGMYAPSIIKEENSSLLPEQILEVNQSMNNIQKTEQSCILYGVPKVAYTFEECTPFCVALKACLNYMGQQIDYSYIMAATGAAFRLRWNRNEWDGGNVDIMNVYEDEYEAFRRGFQAAGRSYRILKRVDSSKEEFIRFIKAEIDEGRPVLALGIIGPPEACLITGYQDNGETLLGWNCFQENQEFAKNISFNEAGYFITNSWWENECTLAVMSIGEKQEQQANPKKLLADAIDLLTKENLTLKGDNGKIREMAGGQKAYDAWAKAVGDDKEFPVNAVLPILYERIMCQNDAQVMVGEGRSYAAVFLEWIGKDNDKVADLCMQAARYFRLAAECTFQMNDPKGGFMQDENTTKTFAKPEVRKQIVALIYKAKDYEAKACELLKQIADKL